MYTPVNPSFIKETWGLVGGSKLCRRVFVMMIVINLVGEERELITLRFLHTR